MNQPIIDNYAAKMADLQLSRNPLSVECMLVFNDVTRDIYQDAVVTEVARIKKRCLVKKSEDMHYVQEQELELLEDYDANPWIVSITTSNLPRIPKMDDQVVIEGIKYTISQVKPINRSVQSIILMSVYPERSASVDNLYIYSLDKVHDDVYSIVYGGNPTHYSFSKDSIRDKSLRLKFQSFLKVPDDWTQLIVFDSDNYVVFQKK